MRSSRTFHFASEHALFYRLAADEACLGSPRVGPRRHFARSRRAAQLGRLGRLRRRPRQAWRLSARSAQTDARDSATTARSTAISATPASTPASTSICNPNEGIAKFRRFMRRGGRSRRQLRRLALRANTATDKPAPNSSPHVRPRTHAGLPRIQGAWDPDWKMNPGKVDRALQAGRKSAPRRQLQPVETANPFPIYRRPRELSRAALRCVGVGKCRREEGGVMCPSCASRTTRNTPRAAARTCSGR